MTRDHRLVRFPLLSLLSILGTANVLFPLLHSGRRDFFSFIASGRALLEGSDPYAASIDPALTPPLTLPLLTLLAHLDPWSAYVAWWIFSIGLYFAVVALLFRVYPSRKSLLFALWTIAFAPVYWTLWMGQIYVVLLVLVVIAWLALRQGRQISAGLAIGLLVALKPNFGLWPALLLCAGHRRPAVISSVTAAALTVLPITWYGWTILLSWLEMGSRVAVAMAGRRAEMSLNGIMTRLDLPIGGLVTALFIIGIAIWALRIRPQVPDVNTAALVASLLVGPISWYGYGLVLLPAFFDRPWSLPTRLAAMLLTFPVYVLIIVGFAELSPVMSVYALALLLLLVGVLAAATSSRVHGLTPAVSQRSQPEIVDAPPVA